MLKYKFKYVASFTEPSDIMCYRGSPNNNARVISLMFTRALFTEGNRALLLSSGYTEVSGKLTYMSTFNLLITKHHEITIDNILHSVYY